MPQTKMNVLPELWARAARLLATATALLVLAACGPGTGGTGTGPINGAKGRATGFELAFQTYFDKLPGWLAGFGIQANYTYVDSKTKLYDPVGSAYCSGGNSASNLNLNLNGCDTDGRTFGNLPLQNLSKNAYNLALLYGRGDISARLAYSWRSKYLQAVNVNGTQIDSTRKLETVASAKARLWQVTILRNGRTIRTQFRG